MGRRALQVAASGKDSIKSFSHLLRIHAAGAGLTLAMGALVIASYGPPIPWWLYLGSMAVAWSMVLWGWRAATDGMLSAVVGWALVVRMVGFASFPIYEDDDWRYRWDGWRVATAGDPFRASPSTYFGDTSVPAEGQMVLDHVNNPTLPTIYGPVCQVVFGMAHLIDPWQRWPLKMLFGLAELGVLAWAVRRHPVRQVLLYAWCPLILQETWCSGHVEILGVLPAFIGGSLMLAGRDRAGGILLGLALAARLTALPAFLVLAWMRPRGGLWALATCAVCYLPFATQGQLGFDSAGVMLHQWQFNAFGHAALTWLWGPPGHTVALIIAAVGLFIIAWYWRQHHGDLLVGGASRVPPAYLLALPIAWSLAWSPVVNAWYVVWLTPALISCPRPWLIAIMVAMPLSYLTSGNLGYGDLPPYSLPGVVRAGEGIIIGVGMVMSVATWKRARYARAHQEHRA